MSGFLGSCGCDNPRIDSYERSRYNYIYPDYVDLNESELWNTRFPHFVEAQKHQTQNLIDTAVQGAIVRNTYMPSTISINDSTQAILAITQAILAITQDPPKAYSPSGVVNRSYPLQSDPKKILNDISKYTIIAQNESKNKNILKKIWFDVKYSKTALSDSLDKAYFDFGKDFLIKKIKEGYSQKSSGYSVEELDRMLSQVDLKKDCLRNIKLNMHIQFFARGRLPR